MLTEQQITDFNRDGFLIVRGLFSGKELDEITSWTNEVAEYPEVPGKYMMYFEQSRLEPGKRILNRMEDIEPFHEGFSRLFKGDKLQGVVSDLFGEPAVLFKDKINFKMPGGDGFKAHQDIQAGWDTYAKLHITALVSIDASNSENGCLELAPAHHKEGFIGEKWKPLEEDALDYVQVPTEPGDAVFFDSFAPHRSRPNNTDAARRVLYVTYNRLSEGDHRRQYYADKRKSYPPDCEREPDKEYVFRV
ncbi:MAG TPA: phytanoyl-CoA dioxygenase family protein [Gammaproteobacteria bacterium]|nr:phytanoyl-CoA dioxygenase family protein [Gammaproteobacteria bacterium]